jgi:hypothetical protein
VRIVLVAAVTAALLGLGASSGLATSRVAPAVKFVKLHPFTVRGSHFKAGERVVATLTSGKHWTATRTATAAGTFTASFATSTLTKCSAYSVRAVGSRGSHATLKPVLPAACTGKPTAALTFATVVEAKGAHFKPGEALAVSIVTPTETFTRHVKATGTGTFSADFGALSINDCSEYTLKVVGSLQSRFSFSHALVPC